MKTTQSPSASRSSSFPRTPAAPCFGAGCARWTGASAWRRRCRIRCHFPTTNFCPWKRPWFSCADCCEPRKLTLVSYLRRDPLVPELLGVKRVAKLSSRQQNAQKAKALCGRCCCSICTVSFAPGLRHEQMPLGTNARAGWKRDDASRGSVPADNPLAVENSGRLAIIGWRKT